MPPFVGRKRSPPSNDGPSTKRVKVDKKAGTLAPASLKKAQVFSLGSDSESSLSEVDSDDFEDVIKPRKINTVDRTTHHIQNGDDSDHEDAEFEDVIAGNHLESDFGGRERADVKLNIAKNDEVIDYSAARRDGKKGPNRREKTARVRTHQVHVQFLLWHNAIRNSWIGDKQVQDALMKQLPSQIVKEVEKWKRASGLAPPEQNRPSPREKRHKKKRKNNHRDWGQPSQRLEEGRPDMSHGDPIISLLRVLSAYWKRRFAITAPGLRKRGYSSKLGLKQDIDSYKNEKHHPAKHGERIRSLEEFRELAKKCEGSRDVGAQLFTALLRAVGIEARLVASLQPAGYGWTKAEEMAPRKSKELASNSESSEVDIKDIGNAEDVVPTGKSGRKSAQAKARDVISKKGAPRKSGQIDAPIELDSDVKVESASSDDESVVDMTPSIPHARPAKYDRDLAFPIYWTEAISPITHKVIQVSPLVLENPVATSPEIVSTFEPRGAKAEKVRQVMAYVIAYSPDGTAKDVTVRYLRKRLWPGKTKGVRYPLERVPMYNERGKVVDYEAYDWFDCCMRGYRRPYDRREKADELEDDELAPAEPERRFDEGDTLQSLKSSSEWVLERHLRREEALRPDAKPDRIFRSGKGDKELVEGVYSRDYVERCLTTESWHKEGRIPKEGEMPMKFVPVRAVTLTRKREAEEHKQRTGETQMQGLYSIYQTEYIIPPPIKDGKIPKNSYGNIDCFVDSMIPRGAVHVPLKGTPRLCKKLEIDFAEAVVGFEFGNKMAVPVIQGVVIAAENEQMLREAWDEWSVEQKRKEDEKLQRQVLELWRKFVIGLRIRQRVSHTYDVDLDVNRANSGATREEAIDVDDRSDMAGGFTAAAEEEADHEDAGGGFLIHHEEHIGDELVMEEHDASQQHNKLDVHVAEDRSNLHSKLSARSTTVQRRQGKQSDRDNQKSSVSATSPDDEDEDDTAGGFEAAIDSDEIARTTQARRRGRPSKPQAARVTPSRRARGKAPIVEHSDTDSEDADEVEEEVRQPQSAAVNGRGKGRGRPRKAGRDARAGKSLLRKEGTLVTSPYFSGSSQ